MKIATYNLTFLFDTGDRLHSGKLHTFTMGFVEKRIAYFVKQFDILNADILFLQELGDESVLQKILENTKSSYEYFIAKPDEHGVGNAVVWKKNIICQCYSIPTNTRLPVFQSGQEDSLGAQMWSRRDYVKLETLYKKRPLHLLGIHIKSNFLMHEDKKSAIDAPTQTMSADGIIRSEFFRFSQAKKVREILDSIFKRDPRSLIGVLGDFNAQTSNKVYDIIRGHVKQADDALVPALVQMPEEKRYSIVGKSFKGLIDHVLISKDLSKSVSNVDILNSHISNHSQNPAHPFIVESDHAPIIITLA